MFIKKGKFLDFLWHLIKSVTKLSKINNLVRYEK